MIFQKFIYKFFGAIEQRCGEMPPLPPEEAQKSPREAQKNYAETISYGTPALLGIALTHSAATDAGNTRCECV